MPPSLSCYICFHPQCPWRAGNILRRAGAIWRPTWATDGALLCSGQGNILCGFHAWVYQTILAERAIALPVTLSTGPLFANWKLFQPLSNLIVKVILAICMRVSAQLLHHNGAPALCPDSPCGPFGVLRYCGMCRPMLEHWIAVACTDVHPRAATVVIDMSPVEDLLAM